MDIIFYKLQDEVNDVKKLRTLTAREDYTPLQVSGTLKGATSKVAPSIDFSKPVTYFNGYNYCYIADFNRYYFVTDIISNRNDFTTLDLRVDVLTSFLTQSNMGNLEGYVGRCNNPSHYNVYVPDSKVQFESKPEIKVYEPTNVSGNIVNVSFSTNPSNNVYISLTASNSAPITELTPGKWSDLISNIDVPTELRSLIKASTSIDSHYFRPSGNIFAYVTDCNETTSGTYDGIVGSDFFSLGIILNYAIKHSNAESFINSIVSYPFSIPYSNLYTNVYINNDTISLGNDTYLQMKRSTKYNSGYLVLKDFTLNENLFSNNYDDFTLYEPYTKCEIFLPFVSWVDINLKENLGCRLMVIYNVDYASGQATVFIYNYTKDAVIYQTSCMIGVSIPVNTTNMRENELKDQNYVRNLLTGLGVAGASITGAVLTQNPYLAVGGITTAVHTVANYINNENVLLDRQTTKGVSTNSISGWLTGLKVLVKMTKLNSVNYNNTAARQSFKEHLGISTNKILTLSNISYSGFYHTYAEITDLHTTSESGLYSLGDITLNEVDELKTLCSQGIYL